MSSSVTDAERSFDNEKAKGNNLSREHGRGHFRALISWQLNSAFTFATAGTTLEF